MICDKFSQSEQAKTEKTECDYALHMPMSPVIPYFTLISVYVNVLFMYALCPNTVVQGHGRRREIGD